MEVNKRILAILILVVGLVGFQAFFVVKTYHYTSERFDIKLQELLYQIADEIAKDKSFETLINSVIANKKLNDKRQLNNRLQSFLKGDVFNENDVVFEIFENKFQQSKYSGFHLGNLTFTKDNYLKIKQHHFCLTCVLEDNYRDKESYLELGGAIKNKNKMIFGAIGLPILLSILFVLLLTLLAIHILYKWKQASELNNQKDDFINNLTHELKTPVFSISMLSGLINKQIKGGGEAVKIKEYNNLVKQEAKHLQNHIERILSFAKIEINDNQFKLNPVQISALISEITPIYKARANAENCHFAVENQVSNSQILADEVHLKNVLNALLDNAFKYGGEANLCNVNLTVEAENNNCWICITDNGLGIDDSEKEKVFDKFYRVETGNVHNVKGFGLGLSYVKVAVAKMGGSLLIEDAKPKGIIVKLCFKLFNK